MVTGVFYGTTAALAQPMPRDCDRPAQHLDAIELKAERLALLFDPLDPSPLPSRDIAKPVESFILDWARALRDAPVRIVIRVPDREMYAPEAVQLKAAVSAYFSSLQYRRKCDQRDVRQPGRAFCVRGFDHPWMGGELASDRDLSL